ncbi:FAD-binding oxidoreductase [Kribbella sp. NBC_00359]|uniref:FAD-binding oxidoreductase n=1 Tax=Kribbella sp. NBC_00359 TaxID=2975966 RepID=UPI002E210490
MNGLPELIKGPVVLPGDPGWDSARGAWHLLADQQPVAVVQAADADDIVAAVRYARDHGLTVSAQPIGHGATPAVNGTILLRTGALTGIEIDLAAGVVHVGAGVRWHDLNHALTDTGTTSLPGSSGGTTVVGYTLGGGLSWFGRKYGLAANHVRSFRVVTASGELMHVTRESDPDLFWALRGGGGDFAIVISMELELMPAAEIQGGRMMWPIEHARPVLRAFAEITAYAPDELSLWAWVLHFPDVPFVPEQVRGQSFAVVDCTFLGSADDAAKLLAPLRVVAEPVSDTVAPIPLRELGSIAQEPEDPMPALLKTVLLSSFEDAAIDALLKVAAPGSPLFAFEVRHLGGALARPDESQGAAGVIDEPYLLLFGGFVPDPALGPVVGAAIERVQTTMAPWITGRALPNFSAGEPNAALYPAGIHDRLVAIKQAVDPAGTIRGNHPVS